MTAVAIKLFSAWQLVFKRALSSWRLLSSVVLGVLLASGIMAGTVVYFDALREVALRVTLDKLSQREVDILMQGDKGPTDRRERARVEGLANSVIASRVEWMVRDRYFASKTPTFFLAEPGREEEAGGDDARAYFAYLPRLMEHSTLVAGRLPRDDALNNPGQPLEIEAIIPAEAAQLFGLQVADRVATVPHWDDEIPSVTVVVSGIFERNEPGTEFWYLEDAVLNAATGPTFRTAPLHISEAAYFDVLGPALPRMDSIYAWLLSVDDGRINAGNSGFALFDTEAMNSVMSATLSTYRQSTALDNALREYDRRLFFSKLPMFVVLILIAIVILYYVVTLASLTVEERRAEVALLRSRGANSSQIMTVFVLEGATIAGVAAGLGPILAALSISFLGYTPAFSDLTGGDRLVTTISPLAYAMSGIGGALSFAALIVPAVQASRISVTQQRQQAARPTSQPAFQRYYLDVVLLLVSLFLFRQLTEQGSVVATQLFGDLAVNQMLLALPGLMLVASAMVLLRLFPLAMQLGSRISSKWLPAGAVLGVWQMARNPAHYARLSLLLILTAGLGIFASSFGATLERSFEERVLYSTGSDVRVDGVREHITTRRNFRRWGRSTPTPTPTPVLSPTPRATIEEAYGGVEGVEVVSPVFRNRGNDLSKFFGDSFTMIALEPDSFSEVAWFRDDFAGKPMAELLGSLTPDVMLDGITLPQDAAKLSVRLKADRPHPSVRVTARVRNARERYSTHTLGQLGSSDWQEMEADLRTRISASLPLTLVSLRLEETNPERRLQAGSIIIDQVAVRTHGGETIMVEPFDDTSGWSVLKVSSDTIADIIRDSAVRYDDRPGTALFSWGAGRALSSRGIFYGPGREPIAALASRSFVLDSGHVQGDEFEVSVGGYRVPLRLQETVSLFPTMITPNDRFLIVDLMSLRRYANMGATFRSLDANEAWLMTEPSDAGMIEDIGGVRGFTSAAVLNRQKELDESKVDPLVKAGWRSLLFLAFGAVLILSCVGFLAHAYVSFRNRQMQFALLRTVGLSSRQLMTMVWLEQILVIASGLALGTWMGGRLGAIIMPFLGHDDWGGQVLPPFVLQVNWGALLITYFFMLAVFALITFGIIWLIHRISVQRMLRLGEM